MTEPGKSQNSASSGVIFSTRMFGSSALSHQAFAGVENSCLILARSLETMAVPVTETYFWSLASAKDRLTFGIAGDFLVLVTPRVGQEIDRVVLAFQKGAHRPCAKFVAVMGDQHRKADLLHQFPGAIRVARVVVGHVSLHRLISRLLAAINGADAAMFRATRVMEPDQRGQLPSTSSVLLRVLPVSA